MSELSKSYEPSKVEPRWRERWAAQGLYRTDEHSAKPPYCIVIPPPNVTGQLHMGHAMYTLQDVLTRWKRMAGFEALWLPGTDHAGIATQVLVERHLRAQGVDPKELGREKFVDRVWEWKDYYHDRITNQIKKLGYSVDWSRERFTMDDGLSRAVRYVFVSLYKQGLIYQADRLVNWDPVGQTVLSDLEVEQDEEDGSLWHIAYPVVDDPERRLVVATTRPETMLGDTAVAVHPDDDRHNDLIGKHVVLPLTGRTIPVIGDPIAADMEFGSGAVKITPGHDFDDFETGLRNDLPRITILDKSAHINDQAPEPYRGLDRLEARSKVVEDLEAEGLLVTIEPYRFAPGRSHRTGAVVEPMSIGKQWFVDAPKMAPAAIDAVETGKTRFVPQVWEKTFYNWMENIREWCISRQLWWGHQVPAWYNPDGDVFVAMEKPTDPAVIGCDPDELVQDTDVLDTWFSSALWPFSTLGWPEKTAALSKWYPTDVLETGYDIIFFWVARMMMMGLHFMGDVPFKVVYMHGMVRDRHGTKMSKTKGNVIDPLHVVNGVHPEDLDEDEQQRYAGLLREYPDGIEAQGADALRFTLTVLSAQGRDIKLDMKRVEGYRAFLNKLWQATRFALNTLDDYEPTEVDYDDATAAGSDYDAADRWILGRLHRAVAQVGEALSTYNFAEACDTVYHFAWGELCGWYIELSKATLYDREPANAASRRATQATLVHCLDVVFRLLHPICPYVTEELWQALPLASSGGASVAIGTWPTPERVPDVPDTAQMALALEVITGIRAIRGNNNINPGLELPRVVLITDDAGGRAALEGLTDHIGRQAKVAAIEVAGTDVERPSPAAASVQADVEILIPLAGVIDLDAERARLLKEIEKVEDDIAFVSRKLDNEKFVSRAPAAIVQKERDKLESLTNAKRALEDAMAALDG